MMGLDLLGHLLQVVGCGDAADTEKGNVPVMADRDRNKSCTTIFPGKIFRELISGMRTINSGGRLLPIFLDLGEGGEMRAVGFNNEIFLIFRSGGFSGNGARRFRVPLPVINEAVKRSENGKSDVAEYFQEYGHSEFPKIPRFPRLVPARGLLAVIRKCSHFAADEAGRYALNGVLLNVKRSEVVATDGRRLAAIRYPLRKAGLDDNSNILVRPLRFFRAGFLRNAEIAISARRSRLWFESENWRGIIKLDDPARFPDYAGIIPKQFRAEWSLDKNALRLLKDFAEKVAKSERPPDSGPAAVTFDLGSEKCRLSSDVIDKPLDIPADGFSGQKVTVTLDAEFLLDGLALGIDGAFFNGAQDAVMFRGKGLIYLVMPIAPA